MPWTMNARSVVLTLSISLALAVAAAASAQTIIPLAPPDFTTLRDPTHAEDLGMHRSYVWDPAQNSWTDHGHPVAARLQDTAIGGKVAKAQAEVDAALKACDGARFQAGLKALNELLQEDVSGQETLKKQIARLPAAANGAPGELGNELNALKHDEPIIRAMIANDVSRSPAACEHPTTTPEVREGPAWQPARPEATQVHPAAVLPPGAQVYTGDPEHAGSAHGPTYRWDAKAGRWINIETGVPYEPQQGLVEQPTLPPNEVFTPATGQPEPPAETQAREERYGYPSQHLRPGQEPEPGQTPYDMNAPALVGHDYPYPHGPEGPGPHQGQPPRQPSSNQTPPPLTDASMPSLEDPGVYRATLKPRKAIDEAIANCDPVAFAKAIEDLEKVIADIDAQLANLNKEKAKAEAAGRSVDELDSEISELNHDKDSINTMIGLERLRVEQAKCGEHRQGQPPAPGPTIEPPPPPGEAEQPTLPPHETFEPPRQPTNLEIAVLDEINKSRTDPHAYRLASIYGMPPGDAPAFLAAASPVPALVYDPRLAKVAIAHLEDEGPKGGVSHIGSDGSRPAERMRGVGVQTTEYAEVISIAMKTADEVVAQLTIDPSNPQHDHRTDLHDPLLVFAGVACGPNVKYQIMCVIDLASRYVAAPAPEVEQPTLPPHEMFTPSPQGQEEASPSFDRLLPRDPALAKAAREAWSEIDAAIASGDAARYEAGRKALKAVRDEASRQQSGVKDQIGRANKLADNGGVGPPPVRSTITHMNLSGPPELIAEYDSLDGDFWRLFSLESFAGYRWSLDHAKVELHAEQVAHVENDLIKALNACDRRGAEAAIRQLEAELTAVDAKLYEARKASDPGSEPLLGGPVDTLSKDEQQLEVRIERAREQLAALKCP